MSGETDERGEDDRPAVGGLDETWNVRGSTLFRDAEKPGERTRYGGAIGAADLATALDRGAKTVRETTPDRDGYVVPLHDADAPTVSATYVLWRPESEQLGWYDTSFGIDGTVRFVSLDTVAETDIGDRLRYWLPAEEADDGDSGAAADGEHGDRGDDRDADDRDEVQENLPATTVEPTATLSEEAVSAVFEDLQAAVAAERAAERRANRATHDDADLETLVEQGVATGPFVPLGRANRPDALGEFRLRLADDGGRDRSLYANDGIYPDSVLLVDALDADADGSGPFPFAVRTTHVDGALVTAKADRSCSLDPSVVEAALTDRDREFWLTPLLNPVPFERRSDALARVAVDESKRALLAGNRPVRFARDERSTPSVDIELNEYQQRALEWAADAEDVVCIHGPPGTGKTRTLTAYVLHAVWHDQSVLVTAHSNQAVDNLLVGDSTLETPDSGTLHAFAAGREGDADGGLSIARVGGNSKNPVVRREYGTASVANADVVAATTSGAASFDTDEFDVAVVDEATQVSRPATAIVLDSARKLVLSGDHRQLPPYAASEPDADTDRRVSWFETLMDRYGSAVSVLLGRQYRMHEAIASFPNDAFYDGDLETAARNRDWCIDGLEPLVGVDVDGEERPASGESYANPAEADAVVEAIERLLAHGVAPADVGVIAAYRGQVELVRRRLAAVDAADVDRVTVDTVDSFQGGEREAIVVSFVRSNDDGRSGFLERPGVGPRRLNVALTRARKRLVLVGDWTTLSAVGPDRTSSESCAGLYDDLRERLADADRLRDRR